MNHNELHFKISAGLKNIIGQDLITNDFVAVFELVKNSYDAHASKVDILFLKDRIYIIDDGKGMTYEDITEKWLFVAYSAKRDGTEDADKKDVGVYAGSKGVGRFSCDRLGETLRLQTRAKSKFAGVQVLYVDWKSFEIDDKKEFAEVSVDYKVSKQFKFPEGITSRSNGTVLEIAGIRSIWNREKLIELKGYLSKLINPIENSNRPFEIYIHAPAEKSRDKAIYDRERSKLFSEDPESVKVAAYSQTVNGKIENFIFRELTAKTTHIHVIMSDAGKSITTTLVDRGELIYEIREKNPYPELANSDFIANIHYLNQAAKSTFTRRTGIRPVQFGSVFLFRNGFRVFPVGEPGDDAFGIDHRKQQGYARFLGTREIIGRIDVQGTEQEFKEATSRDQGLIETRAYAALKECIQEKCLKRLENYVVGVTWADKLDADQADTSRLQGDKARARIIKVVSKLVNDEKVELLRYSKNLISIINEKAEEFADSLKALRLLAGRTKDDVLADEIRKAETRYRELREAEKAAREQAEAERQARLAAEAKARKAEQAQREAEAEKNATATAYQEERKRNLFLSSVTSFDYETILNLHHQIGIYSSDIHHLLELQIDKLKAGEIIEHADLLANFEILSYKNQQILSVSRIATKANFRLDSEKIKADLVEFIIQYIEQVCSQYVGSRINVIAVPTEVSLEIEFKPIEITMVIDNLVSNAQRARASEIRFEFSRLTAKIVELRVSDDGVGLKKSIQEPNRIFEMGFSTTEGSGLGLYHVSQILDSMKGSVDVNHQVDEGVEFIIRLPI